MARIRSAKPEWWSKVKWCALSRDVRFTYKGIWEVMADDQGRFQADVRLIKGDVWPLDDDITIKKIEKWLAQLQHVPVTDKDGRRVPAVLLYEVDGVRYGFLPGFVKHQKISHPTPSKLPPPPEPSGNNSGKAPESLRPDGSGAGLGEDGIKSGADGRESPPEKRATLPLLVDRFLETFYGSATPERREEVKQQLRDTLTEEGAKLRRGEFVKARNSPHLASCLRETIRTDVKTPDKAIVVLLKKLTAPELDRRGLTVTEAASADTHDEDRLIEEWRLEAAAAGLQWGKNHPEEFAEIEQNAEKAVDVPSDVPGYEILRKAYLTQKCAESAGFPAYEEWLAQREVTAA